MKPQAGASLRTPLARASGLGSARSGVEHWWTQRVTAVALVPLTVWLTASIVAHAGDDHATLLAWLGSPVQTVLIVLLLIALFWHMALGLQVVIEDYVHSGMKIPLLLAVRFGSLALAVIGILAILRIAFGG